MPSDDAAGPDSTVDDAPTGASEVPSATGADEATTADGAAEAAARRALWPWVARRTRSQVVALVLISCLALGPAFALVSILRGDARPVNDLITAPAIDPDITRVTVTATGLSPTSGELRTRILVSPSSDLLDDSGRLTEAVSVAVNGATTSYEQGATISSFEVSLSLAEGSTTRYPFDRYRGALVVVVSKDGDDEAERVPVAVDVRSVVGDFALSASPNADMKPGPNRVTIIDWRADRPATTTVYAIWLMVLMWGLAVTGLLIVWAVVTWMIDIPYWVFGYFVGVLFALPPLRESLPGRPPPGTIFDFVSFYWSVTIIGVSLILMLAIWLQRTRAQQRLRHLDPTRPD